MNVVDTVIERFGGVTATAKQLNLNRTTVQMWRKTGLVPAKYLPRIKILLRNKITYKELIFGSEA